MTTIDELAGRTWRLVELDGAPVRQLPRTPEVTFGVDGRVAGSTGVNRLTSSFTLDGGEIELAQGATTRMAGPPEAMAVEGALVRQLTGRRQIAVDGAVLAIGSARFTATGDGDVGSPPGSEAGGDVPPTDAGTVTVSGSVAASEPVTLPPGAVVTVRVVNVSIADAPSSTLGEQRIEAAALPVRFAVVVAAPAALAGHRMAVSARVEVDGELRWTSDTHRPLDMAAATGVDVDVDAVSGT